MPKLVISTVGTSILTNQIDNEFENSWSTRLQDTANCNQKEITKYHEDVTDIIDTLKKRAKEKLKSDIEEDIREASAELNGIYGLYLEDLEEAKSDEHLLVTTDTQQGRIAADLLQNFLKEKGINNVKICVPAELSTINTINFTQGIAKLITDLDKTISTAQDKGKVICFNLVGGFKALQGYMNTIGMFYANEIIYIFEGQNQELIKIPKLPIKIDINEVEPYKVQLAIIDAEIMPASWDDVNQLPKEWITKVDKELFLSPWGQIIWNKSKGEILGQDSLFKFNKSYKLEYTADFKDDYKRIKDKNYRIKLQEKIANIAGILYKNRDGITALKEDGGIKLRKYTNTEIYHFNISDSLRVTCKIVDGGRLSLRYYGTHDHVERSERI